MKAWHFPRGMLGRLTAKRAGSFQFLEQLEPRILLSTSVLTYRNDAGSTGQNLTETLLTPGNVIAAQFGRKFSTAVNGQVYAQPLYVPNVSITTGPYIGMHNIVVVATEMDSVYALDAGNGAVLWHDSFVNNVSITPMVASDVRSGNLTPDIGITSTPVVDPANNLLYVLAQTEEVRTDGTHYVDRLHALNLADGSEALGGPAVVADTLSNSFPFPGQTQYTTYISGPSVIGNGDASVNGVVNFDARIQLQRPGLSLVNGNIYIGFGSNNDQGPYHGWLLGFSAATMAPTAVFCTSPNAQSGSADQGAIWMAGDRIAADAQGNLYVVTGNGAFDATLNANGFPANGNYGDSVIKLAVDPTSSPTNQNGNGWGLKVVDYFTPQNQSTLNSQDADLGSGGAMLLPDSAGSAATPHLMLVAGKSGVIFLINRDNMGKFHSSYNAVVQTATAPGSNFQTPAYFNGQFYFVGVNAHGEAYNISNGVITASAATSDTFGFPGATPVISANGAANGVLWALDTGSNSLRAYSAANIANELYTSNQNAARDASGGIIKFSSPTVADGMVFVGGNGVVDGYGLFNSNSPLPQGFTDANIGNPGVQGFASYESSSGTWQLTGSGSDIWNASDQFNFASENFTGDGAISAQVNQIATAAGGSIPAYGKAGVMFRASAAGNSAMVELVYTNDAGVQFLYRSATGATAQQIGLNQTTNGGPFTLQLIRHGNTFVATILAGGQTYVGSVVNDAIPATAMVGIVACAHTNSENAAVLYTGVSLTPGTFTDADVGLPPQTGSARFHQNTNSWTITGGGLGIAAPSNISNALTNGQYNYVSQPLSVDSTITARVTSLPGANSAAEAGVMFTGNGFVAMGVTPGGVTMQWQPNNGQFQSVQISGIATPAWVRLSKVGTQTSGFYSTDGVHWIEIAATGAVTLANPGDGYYGGLFSTSGSDTQSPPATFDNVTTLANPVVTSFVVNDGSAQRSMVDSVTVTFDVAVQPGSGAFTLQRGTTGGPVNQGLAWSNPSGDGRTWVITFTGSNIIGNSLSDGQYILTVNANQISDAAGTPLSGGNQTFGFYRLYGDYNGTGRVDFSDFLLLESDFGAVRGHSQYSSAIDYYNNGQNNFADFLQLETRFGMTVAALPVV